MWFPKKTWSCGRVSLDNSVDYVRGQNSSTCCCPCACSMECFWSVASLVLLVSTSPMNLLMVTFASVSASSRCSSWSTHTFHSRWLKRLASLVIAFIDVRAVCMKCPNGELLTEHRLATIFCSRSSLDNSFYVCKAEIVFNFNVVGNCHLTVLHAFKLLVACNKTTVTTKQQANQQSKVSQQNWNQLETAKIKVTGKYYFNSIRFASQSL